MVPRAVGSHGLVILKPSARAALEASLLAHKEAGQAAAASIGFPWPHREPHKAGRPSRHTAWESVLARHIQLLGSVPRGARVLVPSVWKPGRPLDEDEQVKGLSKPALASPKGVDNPNEGPPDAAVVDAPLAKRPKHLAMDVQPERGCCPSHRLPRCSELPHLPELLSSVLKRRKSLYTNNVFDV